MFIVNLRIRKCLGGIEKNFKSKPSQVRRCASRDSNHKRWIQVTSVIASANLLFRVVQFLGQMNTICRRNTTMEWVRVVLAVAVAKRGRTHVHAYPSQITYTSSSYVMYNSPPVSHPDQLTHDAKGEVFVVSWFCYWANIKRFCNAFC